MSDYKLNLDGLDQLAKAFKKMPVIRVGVLGKQNYRKNPKGPTNAEILAKHEFGLDGMPVRSVLRQPIIDNLENYLEEAGAFDKDTLSEVVRSGKILPWALKVSITVERIIADAFATGGFGKWKASNMKYKKNQQTLVETTQLEKSITTEVKE